MDFHKYFMETQSQDNCGYKDSVVGTKAENRLWWRRNYAVGEPGQVGVCGFVG